jgi:hypothetical protein
MSINPNEAVKDLDILLRRLIDPKIEVTVIPGEQTGRVKGQCRTTHPVLSGSVHCWRFA